MYCNSLCFRLNPGRGLERSVDSHQVDKPARAARTREGGVVQSGTVPEVMANRSHRRPVQVRPPDEFRTKAQKATGVRAVIAAALLKLAAFVVLAL